MDLGTDLCCLRFDVVWGVVDGYDYDEERPEYCKDAADDKHTNTNLSGSRLIFINEPCCRKFRRHIENKRMANCY